MEKTGVSMTIGLRDDIEARRSTMQTDRRGTRMSLVVDETHAVFSPRGTRLLLLALRSLSLSLSLSFFFTRYLLQILLRSILSADNASSSLGFQGGGVAVLAIERGSKNRSFVRRWSYVISVRGLIDTENLAAVLLPRSSCNI